MSDPTRDPSMQHVEVERVIAAPIDVVWAQYTDHASWTDWAGLGRVRLERTGSPSRDGVGCVREFSNFGVKMYEEVVSFEPPHRMTYRIVRGLLPLRDHFGEVEMAPRDGGTSIVWRCRFRSRIPGLGGALHWYITRLFRNVLQALSRRLA